MSLVVVVRVVAFNNLNRFSSSG